MKTIKLIGFMLLIANFVIAQNTTSEGVGAGDAGDHNSNFGFYAGNTLTEDHKSNTNIGSFAGRYLQGNSNTLIGMGAGMGTVSQPAILNNNVGIGRSALLNSSGSQNIAIGFEAARYIDADKNVFIGHRAGKGQTTSLLTGDYNVGIGYESLANSTDGEKNIALGYQAGLNNTTGSDNVFMGTGSGKGQTTGNHNVGIGYESLVNNISGARNVSLGYLAGSGNTIGDDNIFMGTTAGLSNDGGRRNIYLGLSAGAINQGHGNVLIGAYSGTDLTLGSHNVCIGEQAGRGFMTSNDKYKLYVQVQDIGDNDEVNTPLLYGEFPNPDNGQEGKLAVNYDRFPIAPDGNPYTLAVNGKTITEEVQVLLETDWPDYVFAEDYELMTLTDLEAEIKTLGHLPGVPSAEEVEENGHALGKMDAILLEKIEELTLHLIDMNKEIEQLKENEAQLRKENETLKNK